LFCRELLVAPADDDWVMFMRRLPSVRTSLLNDTTRPSPSGELNGRTMSFSPEDFPMIEGISCLDIRREDWRPSDPSPGGRIFGSRITDLSSSSSILWSQPPWFWRHSWNRPDPVSHLRVAGSSAGAAHGHDPMFLPGSAAFQNFLPPAGTGLREVWCDVSLATQEISPAGR